MIITGHKVGSLLFLPSVKRLRDNRPSPRACSPSFPIAMRLYLDRVTEGSQITRDLFERRCFHPRREGRVDRCIIRTLYESRIDPLREFRVISSNISLVLIQCAFNRPSITTRKLSSYKYIDIGLRLLVSIR